MTTDDIKDVQIIAKTHDGEYIISKTDDKIIINMLAEFCEFVKLDKNLFTEYSLEELLTDGND